MNFEDGTMGEQGVLDISKINGFDERKDCQAQPEKEWNVVMVAGLRDGRDENEQAAVSRV